MPTSPNRIDELLMGKTCGGTRCVPPSLELSDPPCTSFKPNGTYQDSERDYQDPKKSCGMDDLVHHFGRLNFHMDKWQEMATKAKSNDPIERFDGTKAFRIMLSVSGDIPIQAVIETGIVPFFAKYLSSNDTHLQFEAAWALTNIASGTSQQTEAVVHFGTIPLFVSLLQNDREDIREQGMWGLGNIAGDRPEFRDLILEIPSSIELFIRAVERSKKSSTVRTGVWALSNLCRGRPRPSFSKTWASVRFMSAVISKFDDSEIVSDACWALDGLCDHVKGIQSLLENRGSLRRLVELLSHRQALVQRPALRVIGQIATGTVLQTQEVLECGGLPSLLNLLNSNRRSVRKDACWTLSNIAAGSASQMQALMDHGAFEVLLNVFQFDEELEVKKEAAWAICNATTSGTPEQVVRLINMQCVKPVCDMLEIVDPKVLEVVLDALAIILKVGTERANSVGDLVHPQLLIKEADGFARMNQLLQYPDYNIHCKVSELIANYTIH